VTEAIKGSFMSGGNSNRPEKGEKMLLKARIPLEAGRAGEEVVNHGGIVASDV